MRASLEYPVFVNLFGYSTGPAQRQPAHHGLLRLPDGALPMSGRAPSPGRRGSVAPPRAFRRGEAGVAAVEFALILPVMVIMLLGLSRGDAGREQRPQGHARLAQPWPTSRRARRPVDALSVDDIFKAATIIMQPFDASKLRMVVSQMKVTKVGSAFQGTRRLELRARHGRGRRSRPATYTVPTGFQTRRPATTSWSRPPCPTRRCSAGRITGTINLGEHDALADPQRRPASR